MIEADAWSIGDELARDREQAESRHHGRQAEQQRDSGRDGGAEDDRQDAERQRNGRELGWLEVGPDRSSTDFSPLAEPNQSTVKPALAASISSTVVRMGSIGRLSPRRCVQLAYGQSRPGRQGRRAS